MSAATCDVGVVGGGLALELAVHPHPTLSDSIPEAALAAVGRAIHI